MGIRYRDLVPFNWYRHAAGGFTPRQRAGYPRAVRYYSQAVTATPLWADLQAVWDVFLFARVLRESGLAVEVDHIVPLNHPHVCGLHCPANLKVIPKAENQLKNNRTWPDSWSAQLCLALT